MPIKIIFGCTKAAALG